MDMWILCLFELLVMASAAREAYERIGKFFKSFFLSRILLPPFRQEYRQTEFYSSNDSVNNLV